VVNQKKKNQNKTKTKTKTKTKVMIYYLYLREAKGLEKGEFRPKRVWTVHLSIVSI
jgi:hypothetical protein